MSITESVLLGFDTETTGIDTQTDRIVSAALVRRTPGSCGVTTSTTWLIDPGIEIPDAATRVHGITTAEARAHGRPAVEALEEIAAGIAAGLDSGLVLVAFNAAFDLAILEAELRRHGLATLTERLGRQVAPVADPLVLDRAIDRYRKGKRTLGDLMQVYAVESPAESLHAADIDTVATLDVLAAMAARYPEVAAMELTDLHAYQCDAHGTWARTFNEWLASRGRTPDAVEVWPMA